MVVENLDIKAGRKGMHEDIIQQIDTLMVSCQSHINFNHTLAFTLLKKNYPELEKISKPGEKNAGYFKLVVKLKPEDDYVIKVGRREAIATDTKLYIHAQRVFSGYFADTSFGINTEAQAYGERIPDLKIWGSKIQSINTLEREQGINDVHANNLRVFGDRLMIVDASLSARIKQ